MNLAQIVDRLLLAYLGVVLAGYVAFGIDVVRPGTLAFFCLVDGALAAGVFTMVRLGKTGPAAALAVGFGVLRFGILQHGRWLVTLSGLALGGGVFLVALIFHLLAREGLRFGKAPISGLLLAGVYVAIAPLADLHRLISYEAVSRLIEYALLGLAVGLGVGLGIEVAELLLAATRRARDALARGAAPAGPVSTGGDPNGEA